MRTRIFCLAPASQCVNSPTEAARVRALLEARLSTNLRARRKLDLLRMTEVDIPKRDRHVRTYAYTTRSSSLALMHSATIVT